LGVRTACTTDRKALAGGLPLEYEQYLNEVVPELSSRHAVSPETVRHLVAFYGSRADRVLELARIEPDLKQAVSPESPDLYAQVLYSVLEEGAKTVSDVILRRMHIGITAGRGLAQSDRIAAVIARELKWSTDEKEHWMKEFAGALSRETRCLSA
ncbi:MAG TPA: glycerol-3-phosphate dehydrogenase C-terminal domain-containing protein, partial [Nitrospirota bacterium]